MADEPPEQEECEDEDDRERLPLIDPAIELPPGTWPPPRGPRHTLPVEPVDPT